MKIPDWQYMQISSNLSAMTGKEITEYKAEVNKSLNNTKKELIKNKVALYTKYFFGGLLVLSFWFIPLYLVSLITENKDIVFYSAGFIGFMLFVPFSNSEIFKGFAKKEELDVKELVEVHKRLSIEKLGIERNLVERKSKY